MNKVVSIFSAAVLCSAVMLGFSGCKGGSATSTTSTAGSASDLQDEPNVTFKDLQGKDVTLASYKGKTVLVNFWGTWCEPCRGEIPILINLQQKDSGKNFTVLGVATNDEAKTVDPFIHTTQFNVNGTQELMNYPVVMGSDDINTQFGGLLGMPTSFLINRDGKIVKRYIGAFANADQITHDVEAQL